MKQMINTTGLFLLMSLTSFAGNQDSTRKDTCCTTTAAKTMVHKDDNAPAFTAEESAKAASSLRQQAAKADAEMTFAYAAGKSNHLKTASIDALTDLQVAVAAMGDVFNKSLSISAKSADESMNESHKKAVSLDVEAFHSENVTKMLIASDKDINQHYTLQNGMVVVSSK
jgi:hypothetical protein